MGFSEKHRSYLLHSHMGVIESLRKHYSYFERTQTKKKAYRVPDGITRDAAFCMREILREFPKHWLQEPQKISAERFIEIIRASYATKRDVALNPNRVREVEFFQTTYLELVQHAAEKFYSGNMKRAMLELCMRSSVINRSDRITGDATIKVTQTLIRNLRQMSATHLYQVIDVMAQNQQFVPVSRNSNTQNTSSLPRGKARKIVERNLELIQNLREGL
jgi:hypothetical protein